MSGLFLFLKIAYTVIDSGAKSMQECINSY